MTKEWADRLPKRVRIGPFDFQIEPWHHLKATGNRRWGECSTMELLISVQAEMPSVVKLVDTVLHEVSHAIYWVQQIDDADAEERIVAAMARGWTQIWRDNPDLLAWLSDASAAMRS